MVTALAHSDTVVEQVQVERAACLILHVPDWFRRSDFLDWRQGRALGQWSRPACWLPHRRCGDYTDVFLVFDRRLVDHTPELAPDEPYIWDGTDIPGMPDDIYEAIGTVLQKRDLRYGVLWLTAD